MSAGTATPVRRVMLVDDHPIVRQGLRRLIGTEEGLEVCCEAETVRQAREMIRNRQPDVVVVDLSLKEGDGIELVTEMRAHHPELPVLVLSMHDENIYAERLLAAGASGYIMKHAASGQFIVALRRVLEGGTYVSDAVAARLAGKAARRQAAGHGDAVQRLSNRELQVLQLIGQGRSSREIAATLHLGIKTVETHRQRIKQKLELASSAQLLQYAASWAARR
jgi:DNA-binding NarL/FixJ family response regulator